MSEMIIEPIERYGLTISAEHRIKPLFSKIGVVGAGKEGRNIINMASTAGMEVVFLDESPEPEDYWLGPHPVGEEGDHEPDYSYPRV